MKKIHFLFTALLFAQTFMLGQKGGIFCSQAKIKDAERLNKILNVQYPGDSTIDITYYKLNLTLSYKDSLISGIVTVKFRPQENNLSTFFLDLVNSLRVNSVKLNNSNLAFSQPASTNKLYVTLDKIYNQNDEISVDINYAGRPGSGGFGSFEFSRHGTANDQPIIWTLSEPYGAKDWWPSKDTPADKADSSDVWITADSFFVSVSNGTLIGITNNGDGTKTYKWHNSYPIAGYLISLAMTNYSLHQNHFEYEPGKNMPVSHYIYPEDLSKTSSLFDKTVNMLKIFSDKFGLYPFIREKYGHAEFGWSGGMEHQTCTSIGLGGIDEFIIAHELAHQWFGDKVTCKDWHDIWLNEGFATYSEAIYGEAEYGHQNFIDNVTNDMLSAKMSKYSVYVQNISDVNTIFNYNGTYAKGAVVLHMLRGIVGDSTFFETLRQYLVEPGLSYNVATTADFERIAERVSGKDLKYFFDEWIYGVGYPKYTVSWTSQLVTGNDYKVLLQISQTSNSSPKFFTMPIQIKITTTLGVSTVTIMNDQQTQNFELPIQGQPTSVEFDPNMWIMKNFTIITDYTAIKPISFFLAQNYPNPFNPSTVINYQTPSTGNVLLKIYDITGRDVATLVDKVQPAGNHSEIFDAHKYGLASGIYFYELRAGKTSAVKKMMILK